MNQHVIGSARGGKIHRPRNEQGFLHQGDQSVSQAACGSTIREINLSEPIDKWLLTPWLLCAKCWPPEIVQVMRAMRVRRPNGLNADRKARAAKDEGVGAA